MNLTPQHKLDIRKNIQRALAFLQSMELEAERDRFEEMPHLLMRVDGAVFDLRQILSMTDATTAAILEEYQEEP